MIFYNNFIFIFILYLKYIYTLPNIPIPLYSNIGVMVSIQENNLPNNQTAKFLPAILMAIDDINNKTDGFFDHLLPHTTIRPVIRMTNNDFYSGAYYAREISNQDISVDVETCIGPHGKSTMTAALPAFQQFGGVSVFSYDERSATFSNSELYPNLLRTIPPEYYDAYALAWMIKYYFRWNKVSVFASSTDLGRSCALLFRYYADRYGITILSSHSLDVSKEDYTDEVRRAKKTGVRIIVMFLEVPVAIRLLSQGSEVDFRSEVQLLGGETLSKKYWAETGIPVNYVIDTFNGFMAVKLKYNAPSTPLKRHFLKKWLARSDTTGFINQNGNFQCNEQKGYYNETYLYQFYPNNDINQPPICSGIKFTEYSNHPNLEDELNDIMYAYDSVIATAYTLHELIYNYGIHNPSSDQIHQYLLYNLSFTGLTGLVSFSTELESDSFNIGGRGSGISYDIENFYLDPSLYTNDNLTWDDAFKTVVTWNSEHGIPKCNNISYYEDHNPCIKFYFGTYSRLLISDSPSPQYRDLLKYYERTILKVLTGIGFAITSICIILTFIYRSRRLMKMSQPVLSYIILFGFLLAFIAVYMITYRPSDQICAVLLWFEHVPFQLIFGAIMIKCWRVYNITASLKRKKISDLTCAMYLLIWISPILFTLIAATSDDSIKMKYVTVESDQYNWILEAYCNYKHTQNLLVFLFVYDAFTLFTGMVWCWLIRKVRSTLCNTMALIKSLLTALGIVVGIFATINIVSINPLDQSFIIGVVIALLIIRLLYLLQYPLMVQLLTGYELDQALVLKKSEASILEMLILKKQKVCATPTELNIDEKDSQHLTKYSKFHSKEELDFEIKRLLEEIRLRNMELAFVQNMMFVVSESSSHHQAEKYEKSNGHDSNNPQHNNNNNNNNIQAETSHPI